MRHARSYAFGLAGLGLFGLLAALVLLVRQRTPTATSTTTSTPTATINSAATRTSNAGHHISTVFIILMENHDWSQIKGNASAPYINTTLLPMASHAEQYYNPQGIHPSLPNYLWLEAGANFGILDDRRPALNSQATTAHLVTLLNRAGLSWTSYQENIAGTDCPLNDRYPYAVKHNPQAYFQDVTNNNDRHAAYCIAHERPFTELATDLANHAIARYNFITPNMCNDMHDSCSPTRDSIRQGDTWLTHAVPQILNSQAYKSGGALFITWDEGEDSSSDGPIGMIVLSPFARGHGYADSIHYTHSSTLRTMEEIFGVRPFLGDAAYATDLRDLFATFP
jgi:phospholipase C